MKDKLQTFRIFNLSTREDGEKESFQECSFLWNIFYIFGINIKSERIGKFSVIATKIIPILLHVTQIYIQYASVASISWGLQAYMISVPFCFVCIISCVLWHIMYRRRKEIGQIVKQLFTLKVQIGCKTNKTSEKILFNSLLSAIFLHPSLCALLSLWNFPGALKSYVAYYSLYMEYSNPTVAGLVRVFVSQMVFLTQFSFLGLVTIACSIIYFNLSKLIHCLCKDIEDLSISPLPETLQGKLNTYRAVFKVAKEVEKSLSLVSLLLLCSQVVCMFVTIAALVSLEMFPTLFWECLPAMTMVPLSVIGMVMCASGISSGVERLRSSLKELQDKFLSVGNVNLAMLRVVDSMKGDIFPEMTAGGVVELKSNLILSVFGSLFTYGFLIVNIDSKRVKPETRNNFFSRSLESRKTLNSFY